MEAWVKGSATARHAGNFNMAADFEFGICNLLRSNINYLHQSFQILGKNVQNVESGELVWTDGENVWLSPVTFQCNDSKTIFTSKERSCVWNISQCVNEGIKRILYCYCFERESRGFVEDYWRNRREACEGVLYSMLAPKLCVAPQCSIVSSAVENVSRAVMFFRGI